jgi:hypothetical protein
LIVSNKIGSENPGNRGRGRPKGSQNKLTVALKDMILTALDRAGGVDYLLTQADDNPTAFMTLVGKVLPLQVAGDPDHPLVHEIRRTIVRP